MKINREKDLHFFKLIKNNVLYATKEGLVYETCTSNLLNKKYRLNFYKRLCYRGTSIQAHRFVWMFFNGLIQKNLQVNHKNGIKHDNRLENLEIVTNSENVKHAYDNNLIKITEETKKIRCERQLGSMNTNAKLTDDQVIFIRKEYIDKNITSETIQKEYKLSRRTVENLLLGRTYAKLPFISNNLHSNYKCFLSKELALEIRQLYSSKNYTQKEISILFNVSRSTIRDIISYRTYK